MRLPWTAEFDAERERFALRFACEDCGHFDPPTGQCRHEWPNQGHRQAGEEAPRAALDFCKEFELC